MKRTFLVICLIAIIIFSLGSNLVPKLNEMNRPIEERAIEKLSYDTIKVFEFDKGCICFSKGNKGLDKECLFLTYLENDLFSKNCLAVRGGIGEKYYHFLKNSDLSKCLVFNLDIFSDNTIYYSCCETRLARPVMVNGKDIELHNVEFEWNDKSYNLTFWFFMAPKGDLPKVEFK